MKKWADVYAQLHIDTADQRVVRACMSARQRWHTPPERLQRIMSVVAFESGQLEGDKWDRWDVHTAALVNAYEHGRQRKPVTLYNLFRWHGMILPHGGSLRTCNPVSVGMGESFQPHDWRTLPQRAQQFVAHDWPATLRNRLLPLRQLAQLHFIMWQVHFFADGNKRNARLWTVYGCGWFGLPPVCITLAHKAAYLDALRGEDIVALARLFETCLVRDNG